MSLLLFLVPATLGLAWASHPRDAGRRARLALRRVPRSALTRVELGERVRLAGRVASETELRAPLTGRECVAFRVHVRRPSPRGWRTELDRTGITRFRLRDGRVDVLVDASDAQVLLSGRRRERKLHALPARIATVLPEAATRRLIHRDHHAHQALESVLVAGDRVTLVGRMRLELEPDSQEVRLDGGHYRQAPRRSLGEERTRRVFVAEVISDLR